MVEQKQSLFYQLATSITAELGPVLSTRPYLAIVSFQGEFKFLEAELEQYKDFISNFVKSNFHLLNVGDHSIPISGTNLAFFKVSKKALIVIYIKKGLIGQLLSFTARMEKYQKTLDVLIPEEPSAELPAFPKLQVAVEPEPAVLEKKEEKSQVIPVLLKEIDKKAKFPLNEVVILNYCTGKNNIEHIMSEGHLDRKALWDILDKYKKKGWLKITYTGKPIFIPVLSKEIPVMAIQLGVVNKKEFEVGKLCNGKNTVADIQKALGMSKTELDEVIDKMEKNGIIHLEVK